jgi:hypothetical protein
MVNRYGKSWPEIIGVMENRQSQLGIIGLQIFPFLGDDFL